MRRAVCLLLLLSTGVAFAQTEAPAPPPADLTLAPVNPEFTYSSLGPVASKAYDNPTPGARLGLSADFFSGGGGTPATVNDPAGRHTNVASIAPTFGFRPHPRLVFNAQVGFENGGAETSQTVALRRGGAIVRFAYLDWSFREGQRAGVRLGHQLMPVGISNTSADAITYFGVLRPELERALLLGDWHENGALAYYDERNVTIEAGAFTSLNARGLRGGSFLAGGRSQGQNGPSDNVMGVLRVNSHDGGMLIGGSLAFGDTAQGNVAIPGGAFKLGEVHARYRASRYELQAQVAQGRLADAGLISIFNDTVMGEVAAGGSAHAAIELMGAGERKLWLYGRATSFDLHHRVPPGFAPNPRLHQTIAQVGAHYVPIPTLVLKVDLARHHLGDDSDHHEVWAGAGFIY